MSEKLEELTEFECKYKTEEAKLIQFKKVIETVEGLKSFLYVQGGDTYYTTKMETEASFARYRKAEFEKNPKAWLTFKKRLVKGSSYKRKEPNIVVTGTPIHEIEAALEMHGYKKNFEIYKFCHIYKFADATLVFYTVVDDTDKHSSFIEIEVDEATISNLTEEDAWVVIRKYEEYLELMGISYKNRLQKSLFDMFRQDKV